jgi:hypothetical protein
MDKRFIKAAVVVLGALAGVSMLDVKSASAQNNGWNDTSSQLADTCFDPAINDAGTAVGNCILRNLQLGFVRLATASASTQLAALPSTANGFPCGVAALSNASAGNEIIMGWCNDAKAVSQAVFWNSSTPTTAPTLLQPLSLLGLDADVRTQAVAVNSSGVMVGVSISGSGAKTPVTWSSAGAPTQLLAPLGSVNTNCEPVDISDGSAFEIIGNCKDAGTGGANKIVFWVGTGGAYKALTPPSGATSCTLMTINALVQALGQCNYPGDVTHAVVWGSTGGIRLSVLTSINLNTTAKTYAVDMNDSGSVACNFLDSSGRKQPCLWHPGDGNSNASAIARPTNVSSTSGIAVAIGNNGKVAGNYDFQGGGDWIGFSTPPNSPTSIDGGSAGGTGNPNIVSKMSRGGAFEAATWIRPLPSAAIDVVKPVP